jgi:tRNA-modifying protein YgfZ
MNHIHDAQTIIDELKAARNGAFIHITEDRAVLRVDGRDTLDLLNRLSTNKVDALQPGELRETLFTTEKGRVIDAAILVASSRGARLLLSPGKAKVVRDWLERYTIMDDCEYTDVGAMYQHILIYQPQHMPALVDVPQPGNSVKTEMAGAEVELMHVHSVTGTQLRVLCKAHDAAAVLGLLEQGGIPVIHDQAFALWRCETLTPAVGNELTENTNPLESGATAAVDFNKGCYIGQEVIARLDSYDKVQRNLARIILDTDATVPVPSGTPLTSGDRDAGFVTTVAFDPEQNNWKGIACIRNAFIAPGTVLRFDADAAGGTVTVL